MFKVATSYLLEVRIISEPGMWTMGSDKPLPPPARCFNCNIVFAAIPMFPRVLDEDTKIDAWIIKRTPNNKIIAVVLKNISLQLRTVSGVTGDAYMIPFPREIVHIQCVGHHVPAMDPDPSPSAFLPGLEGGVSAV